MSADVIGKIYDKNVGVEDVFNLMKKMYSDSSFTYDCSNKLYDYGAVFFKDSTGERMLTIIDHKVNKEDKDYQYIYLSLGLFGDSKEIIFNIVKQFGGEVKFNEGGNYDFIKVEKNAMELPKIIELSYEDICKTFGGIVKIKR